MNNRIAEPTSTNKIQSNLNQYIWHFIGQFKVYISSLAAIAILAEYSMSQSIIR